MHRCKRNSPPQRRNLCLVFRRYSACGRATFQRRKVAKVLRACGPGPGRAFLRPWQSRPARKSLEGCLKIIAAALLYRRTTCFYKIICAGVSEHTPQAVNRRRTGPFPVCRGALCAPTDGRRPPLRSKSRTDGRMISAPVEKQRIKSSRAGAILSLLQNRKRPPRMGRPLRVAI